jgi:hypothetical protein
VVLAGETDKRPARGLQLLADGYAPKMVIDVPSPAKIYNIDLMEMAKRYVSGLPQSKSISLCPIEGLSTKAEAHDVERCLASMKVNSILLVTSDYHTRRARDTFAHELRNRQVSVAAASDPQQFGASWWEERQWAKMNLEEWTKFVWWEVIDRWRR